MSTLPPALPERPFRTTSPTSGDPDIARTSPPVATPPRLPPRKSYVPTSPLQRAYALPEQETDETVVDDPSGIPTSDVERHQAYLGGDENGHLAQLDQERTREHVVEPEGKNDIEPTGTREVPNGGQSFHPPPNPPSAMTSSAPTTDPMALLNTISTPQTIGSLPIPSPGNIILIAFLIIMAYAGASFITLLIASGGVYYLWADWQRREAARRRDPEEDREKVKGKVPVGLAMAEETTEWLNHILRALFPVLTTDLLTPFIDLLEDVMLQQVPPLVSSIRVTEPSLGEEPIKIVSIRPMSDPEWFEHLSKAPSAPAHASDNILSTLGLQKRTPHVRSASPTSASATPLGHARTESADSQRNNDRSQRIYEVQERRKRDRILRTIGGRRGQGMGAFAARSEKSGETALKPEGVDGQIRAGETLAEGTAVRGDENDAEDGDEGQYVNLAVDFSYDGRKNRKGWDLHFLIFMGMGVKGLAGFEVPIWVTMLKITGTVHIRLLLSPDVPFVRTATISMPNIPEFDFAAKPIKDYAPDVIGLPLVKPYIAKSIREVCDNFVRPNSYTLDVDRLLLGQEAALRTQAIGVMHIRIHGARGLKKADTIGSSDPYCVISFAKYDKPLWSSRTIIDTLNPRWEEDAYILIAAEAIESGEHLRLIIYDGDRWSADDPLGMVSEDLADLLGVTSDKQTNRQEMLHRDDELKPRRKGYTAKGNISWSYAFYPIWKLPSDGKKEDDLAQDEWNKEKHGAADIGTGRGGQVKEPGLLYQFLERFKPEPLEWENEKKKRRLESIAWLTGERAREAMEATQKPTLERRSGVLLFQIHQAIDLELERTGGTLTSAIKRRTGSGVAGGPPALADTTDSGAWEAEKLPSAYAEVILNGKLVFRTRTKQLSPQPYWNARAERFIRDFSVARMVIVVRNEKNREHDPILGLIAFDLAELFHQTSQITRTMPIVGGLGHGLLRISLLFKPIDVKLPPEISGYEVATIKVKSLLVNTAKTWIINKAAVEISSDVDAIAMDYDKYVEDGPGKTSAPFTPSRPAQRESAEMPSTPELLDFQMDRRHRRILAVEYRHSCSLIIRLVDRKGKMKKDLTVGLAMLRLADIADNSEVERSLPIYRTDDVNEAAEREYQRMEAIKSGKEDPESHLPAIRIRIALYTGISRAHKKLTRKDDRLRRVYEAWEVAQDLGDGTEFNAARQRGRKVNEMFNGQRLDSKDDDAPANAGLVESDECGDESDTESDDADQHSIPSDDSGLSDVSGNSKPTQHSRSTSPRDRDGASYKSGKSGQSRFRKWREESKALHKYDRGIMQNQVMRTLKHSKDKVQSTLSSGRSRAKGKHRPHGADLEVEMEGISQF